MDKESLHFNIMWKLCCGALLGHCRLAGRNHGECASSLQQMIAPSLVTGSPPFHLQPKLENRVLLPLPQQTLLEASSQSWSLAELGFRGLTRFCDMVTGLAEQSATQYDTSIMVGANMRQLSLKCTH